MEFLLNLSFESLDVSIVNIVIIAFIFLSTYLGFKNGFLDSSIRFVGVIIAFVGSYIFKNPLSVFMYTHLPFFKIGGIFEGVSVINILIYEFIAFILVFIVLMLLFKLICKYYYTTILKKKQGVV